MKVNELIDALHKYPEKEVVIRLDNGLFCPITNLKVVHNCLVIDGTSPTTSVEGEDFKPLEFGKAVEKIYIIEQEK